MRTRAWPQNHALVFWVADVVSAAGGLAIATALASGNGIGWQIIGALGGALALGGLIFIVSLTMAPFTQRNEARAELNKVKVANKQASDRVFAIQKLHGAHSTGFVRKEAFTGGGFSEGPVSLERDNGLEAKKEGKLVWKTDVGITAIPFMTVEDIHLHIMGKSLASDWRSQVIEQTESRVVEFNIPLWVTPGTHEARLLAFVDGVSRESPPFPLTVP